MNCSQCGSQKVVRNGARLYMSTENYSKTIKIDACRNLGHVLQYVYLQKELNEGSTDRYLFYDRKNLNKAKRKN